MCLLDKDDWKHVKLLLWRGKLILSIKKGIILISLLNFIIFVMVAVFLRISNPISTSEASSNEFMLNQYTSSQYFGTD